MSMPSELPWQAIGNAIGAAVGSGGQLTPMGWLGGGDINRAARVRLADTDYFVKLNRATRLDMFAAEFEGLRELAASHTVRVPAPICFGSADEHAYLALEYLDLVNGGDYHELGRSLAAMHRVTRTEFGWGRDNTIGTTPQPNAISDVWPVFWRERRLGFQLATAAHNGYGDPLQSMGQRLLSSFHLLFEDYRPLASLLHGDLWGGNHAFTSAGAPVIFDPAVYFGDRETDLAMTELFGGYPRDFYAAYQAAFPLDPGYAGRKPLYQLYHVLNHLNLFGSAYLSRATRMIESLLAELK
jgi:fructosamine-3-kinase